LRLEQELRLESRAWAGGNPGDSKSVGAGVFELRIDVGPGYRVYYTRKGMALILLLCGGDKSSQQRDIELAQQLAREPIGEE
jgi:putative addiction module killer protein